MEKSSSIKIDKVINSLEHYLEIFHHLCSMDPLATRSLIKHVAMVKQLIKAEVMDNSYLTGIYNLYKEVTADVERKENEAEEQIRRYLILSHVGVSISDTYY